MADPNTSIEIPTEGEIPRSRDEQGERESEEVKKEERESGQLNEHGVEELPSYDVELPQGDDDGAGSRHRPGQQG